MTTTASPSEGQSYVGLRAAAEPAGALSHTALGTYASLVRVRGDAALVGREVRARIADAVGAGRVSAIVDLSRAEAVGGPLARELCRAHERLLWRGGQILVVGDPTLLDPLFRAFGTHRAPDVVMTLAQAMRALGLVRDETEPPHVAWRRHDELPATWSFAVRGGDDAPRVARAAIERLLRGRLDDQATANALLLVSEAVNNSVLHGGAGASETIELTIVVSSRGIQVGVRDPLGGLPLHSLARTWGVDPPPNGRVWFELARSSSPSDHPITDHVGHDAPRGRATFPLRHD